MPRIKRPITAAGQLLLRFAGMPVGGQELVGGEIGGIFHGGLFRGADPRIGTPFFSVPRQLELGLPIGPRLDVDTKLVNSIISKTPRLFKKIGRHPWRAGMILTGLTMGVNMLGGLMKTFRSEPVGRIASAGTGPGYISWAKQSGMPRNHLSTDGLSLALHKMRHASTI